MASFDRTILPGGEGKITLKVNTKGYEGRIHKSAKVNTDDPKWKVVSLEVKAFVRVSIHVSSRYVYLQGAEDQSITRTIDVKAGLDRPLKLTPGQFSLEGKVKYTVDEIEKGRRFRIRFMSIPGPPHTYQGVLKLKTNYPEKPEITIRIRCRFVRKKG